MVFLFRFPNITIGISLTWAQSYMEKDLPILFFFQPSLHTWNTSGSRPMSLVLFSKSVHTYWSSPVILPSFLYLINCRKSCCRSSSIILLILKMYDDKNDIFYHILWCFLIIYASTSIVEIWSSILFFVSEYILFLESILNTSKKRKWKFQSAGLFINELVHAEKIISRHSIGAPCEIEYIFSRWRTSWNWRSNNSSCTRFLENGLVFYKNLLSLKANCIH